MILGYVIIDPDNGENMFENALQNKCANYSNIYDLNCINPSYQFRKKQYNISSTYEGFKIVSEKFKRFCEKEKYEGLEFVKLPKSDGFYWFKIHNIIEYDTDARKTQFINFNKECNGYEEIIGATPVCLKVKTVLNDSFYRTDICFGSFADKSPLEIVGEMTMKKLRAAGFNDIFFEEILDEYEWQKKDEDPNAIIIEQPV